MGNVKDYIIMGPVKDMITVDLADFEGFLKKIK